ncbi:unnamed protein product [Adineta steineri]|uniref:Uncharacterized protein n=1 Tax=Adineta steineri TaxID=433720 RepID=A0A818RMR8_9BILA|nr:unnamed protein product [Adineta steineri]CAF3653679.1 unnamed protein product [Adineta steineri]
MTESIITISPKTSPYRSKIHTRVATPGSSSSSVGHYISSPHNRNNDQHLLSNEKLQLKKLNDQFLTYIERVRLFETYNNCLTLHCEQIKTAQERTKSKLDLLEQEYDEYQQERFTREKKDLQLEHENFQIIDKQVNEYKNKESFFQHEHDSYRKQIIDLQKQSVDLQAKTEHLRFDYENVNDDNVHSRRQISYYQLLKSSILDEITRQRDINQRTQLEVDDLKMQKQITVQAYEADKQAVEIHNDNIVYDLTTNFRLDGNGKNVLTEMLNEIREEYKVKNNEMRDELHRKYLHEYNKHIKKEVDRNLIVTNREDIERRHLSDELNSLKDKRLLLHQKVTLIQEHYKQLEMNFQREIKRQKNMQNTYDDQINDLRLSVQEYENLLNNSIFIRQPILQPEVNKYRQLLEGSDQQKGLRQLINILNEPGRYLPINRSTTPPPSPPPPLLPPAPMKRSQTISILFDLPSLTRQNSISEASYETAPVSQITTPTATTTNNQQYLTFNSVNDKLSHHDYDTDNDQSQTIQYLSGRSSRLTSATDTTPLAMTPRATTPTNQESLSSNEYINHDETIVEVPIDISHTDIAINQTLPFIPMMTVSQNDIDANKNIISDGQQSPLISTLEKREELENTSIDSIILISSEIINRITIDIDSTPNDNKVEMKIVSPNTPIMSVNEQSKSAISPTTVSNQPEPERESNIVEVPVPVINPLAKLISTMLPNATPFIPTSNVSNNRPVSPVPIPISTMNNNAAAFVPGQQQQHGSGQQQHLNNMNGGQWNGVGARGGGGGNRRGQNGGGGFHQGGGGGGGNQRSGGGNNWNQGGGGGGYQKPRRGQK